MDYQDSSIYKRPNPQRVHVHGYIEEGTTTTPFDMLVRNRASRFHLVIDAVRHATRLRSYGGQVIDTCVERLAAHQAYIETHDDDLPEIRDWRWAG